MFERPRGLMDDESALSEWESMVEEIVGDVEYPVAPVPESYAPLPDDPIYDSSRSYAIWIDRRLENKSEGYR